MKISYVHTLSGSSMTVKPQKVRLTRSTAAPCVKRSAQSHKFEQTTSELFAVRSEHRDAPCGGGSAGGFGRCPSQKFSYLPQISFFVNYAI